ncbi:MAG: peptide deformylase [Bacteroidaceae bacterium]|nr:peptide deformylase [Bacteroidaceae bacterium]
MILPIYTYGQPVLRQVAEDIDETYPELPQLIQNMWDTLARSEGIGLAAPQVGLSIRLIVIDLDVLSDDMPQYKGFRQAYINPYIEEYDDTETDVSEEGCLSLPGVHEKVRRPTRVRLTWLDEQFQEHDEWIDGYLARVVQHEVDHLDGEVFTDHLKGLRRQMVKGQLNDLLKGRFSCSYKVKLKRI